MLGVCFQAAERVEPCQLSDPAIEHPGDAIVKVEMAGLCGSDLHPFFGREQGLQPGTVMGHEFVGTIVQCGREVTILASGDRVAAPFTTNCGQCDFCQIGLTSRCSRGQLFGWRSQGQGLHGGQAEYIRVPLADATLMKIPAQICDEMAILLGDNLSTGYFAAEMANLIAGGTTVVIGCGTVGLLAIISAGQLQPTNIIAIDPNPARSDMAARLGAESFCDPQPALEAIADRTSGRGADSVIELVGLPQAQALAYRAIRPGGTMSVIGCHCASNFAFSPSQAYDKNLTYRTGRCSARYYMPRLAPLLQERSLDLSFCITDRFSVQQAQLAYDTFAYGKNDCIKAVLTF